MHQTNEQTVNVPTASLSISSLFFCCLFLSLPGVPSLLYPFLCISLSLSNRYSLIKMVQGSFLRHLPQVDSFITPPPHAHVPPPFLPSSSHLSLHLPCWTLPIRSLCQRSQGWSTASFPNAIIQQKTLCQGLHAHVWGWTVWLHCVWRGGNKSLSIFGFYHLVSLWCSCFTYLARNMFTLVRSHNSFTEIKSYVQIMRKLYRISNKNKKNGNGLTNRLNFILQSLNK